MCATDLEEQELLLPREVAAVMDVLQSESLAEVFVLLHQIEEEAPECDTPLLKQAVDAVLGKFEAFGVGAQPTSIERQEAKASRAPYSPQVEKAFEVVNMDITWTTKPQVHALAEIIRAHADPGDVVDESFIVHVVRANTAALGVTDPNRAERIWKIYYGDHELGFLGHGNLRRVR